MFHCCTGRDPQDDGNRKTTGHPELMKRIQNQLLKLYGLEHTEVGHGSLTGSRCINRDDVGVSTAHKSDFLFGEVLPVGVSKLLDDDHCAASQAAQVLDLGSGLGKFCLQVFLEHPNVERVIGIELAPSRAVRALEAANRLLEQTDTLTRVSGSDSSITISERVVAASPLDTRPRGSTNPDSKEEKLPVTRSKSLAAASLASRTAASLMISPTSQRKRSHPAESKEDTKKNTKRNRKVADKTKAKPQNKEVDAEAAQEEVKKEKLRSLELSQGDMFECPPHVVAASDIVMCETAVLDVMFGKLCLLLSHMKQGARLITYHEMEIIFSSQGLAFPFKRLPINRSKVTKHLGRLLEEPLA